MTAAVAGEDDAAERRRDRDKHPRHGVRCGGEGLPALVGPTPGEALLRRAAGGGSPLDVPAVGRRGEHDAVPAGSDGVRAGADEHEAKRAQAAEVVEKRLHRFSVRGGHRAERHRKLSRRAVATTDRHRIGGRGQLGEPVVAHDEPVDPRHEPLGCDVDDGTSSGGGTDSGH
jgi:hypothetical protein